MASSDKAFEIFVKRTIGSIQKEAWGRAKDAKDLRDACAAFLSALEQHESGAEAFDGSLAVAVLQPLALACANTNAKASGRRGNVSMLLPGFFKRLEGPDLDWIHMAWGGRGPCNPMI